MQWFEIRGNWSTSQFIGDHIVVRALVRQSVDVSHNAKQIYSLVFDGLMSLSLSLERSERGIVNHCSLVSLILRHEVVG